MLLAVLLLVGKSLGMERLSLQDVQDRALCPFKYRQDIDEHRMPSTIEKVECQPTKQSQITYVDGNGRFNRSCTCTEIYTHLTVEYRRGHQFRKDKVFYPIGCMCVNDTSQRSKEADIQKVE